MEKDNLMKGIKRKRLNEDEELFDIGKDTMNNES